MADAQTPDQLSQAISTMCSSDHCSAFINFAVRLCALFGHRFMGGIRYIYPVRSVTRIHRSTRVLWMWFTRPVVCSVYSLLENIHNHNSSKCHGMLSGHSHSEFQKQMPSAERWWGGWTTTKFIDPRKNKTREIGIEICILRYRNR